MEKSVSYEPVSERDRAGVERLILALYREDPGDRAITGEKIRLTFDELQGKPDKGTIYAFRDRGKIVGYGIVVYYWSNEYGGNIVHIDELYVAPECRGSGIGSGFLDHLASNRPHRAAALALEVSPHNIAAVRFYELHGFTGLKNRALIRLLDSGDVTPNEGAPQR